MPDSGGHQLDERTASIFECLRVSQSEECTWLVNQTDGDRTRDGHRSKMKVTPNRKSKAAIFSLFNLCLSTALLQVDLLHPLHSLHPSHPSNPFHPMNRSHLLHLFHHLHPLAPLPFEFIVRAVRDGAIRLATIVADYPSNYLPDHSPDSIQCSGMLTYKLQSLRERCVDNLLKFRRSTVWTPKFGL